MDSALAVSLTPYVASFIIEHAKRRCIAAGYLFGARTADAILVTDFVPMTHCAGPYQDVTSKAYIQERIRRVDAKRKFTSNVALIGWYSAGSCPVGLEEQAFQSWCKAPSAAFARSKDHESVYLHCALPSPTSPQMEVQWSAFHAKAVVVESTETGKKSLVCQCQKSLPVIVDAMEDPAANVVLGHVISNVLHGGGKPHETNLLMNLDEVVFDAKNMNVSAGDALSQLHGRLQAVLAEARAAVGSAVNPAHTTNAYEETLSYAESIKKLKQEDIEQQMNLSSREDFNTEHLKDSLMTKCMTVLLRKQLLQIEMLASEYPVGQPTQQRAT